MSTPLAIQIRAKKIGVLLRDARAAAGKTLKECAEVLDVSSYRIGTFERGENAPSLPELEGLTYFLGVPLKNFMDADTLVGQLPFDVDGVHAAIAIRQRIIGAKLRIARQEADLSLADLSKHIGVSAGVMSSYERGEQPVPLPELEHLIRVLGLTLNEFRDETGPAGSWALEQQKVEQFLALPTEIQEFVVKPVNTPYLELALKLSKMSAEHLRSVAEGLLDITL